MKKKTKKLVLAKETVRSLEEDLAHARGGMTEECSGARWGCEDTQASRNADC